MTEIALLNLKIKELIGTGNSKIQLHIQKGEKHIYKISLSSEIKSRCILLTMEPVFTKFTLQHNS